MGKLAILCAGGTGGHLFPAQSLAHELIKRGWRVHLATDERAQRFTQDFPAEKIHVVPAATISGKNPIKILKAVMTLYKGYRQAKSMMKVLSPDVMIGFGGYPTLPPMYAAKSMGIPAFIHEQNGVMGRANKVLADRVLGICSGFPLKGLSGAQAQKAQVIGNPVRPEVLRAAEMPFVAPQENGAFNLLVFGGSQGAQFFSQQLPQAISKLSDAQRSRLVITQQSRVEDEAELRQAYVGLGINAEIAPFFSDMPMRIAKSHFVISRAGASTVSELSAIGRASLLVPYPFALDHDQAANAEFLVDSGGAITVQQNDLNVDRLYFLLSEVLENGKNLADVAACAKQCGILDAAAKFADLIEANS
jgi:UDP-N-acetylglucosamine--N-acetylmuramyl-(pentapeptide) pyrophosphoryl-undecaprenol N-acetylglucosamine transferase